MSTFWLQVFSILVGSNVTVSPWSKQTKYLSSPRWPKYTKNAKNEWRPPRKSHSRWDINRPFPQGGREGHCARSARAITMFCGVFWATKHAEFQIRHLFVMIVLLCFSNQGPTHSSLARPRARARRGRRKAKTYRDPETKVKEKWNF